jgi:hypothetical protein
MNPFGPTTQTQLATLQVDGRDLFISLHMAHDGVEYVGRLVFSETGWHDAGFPDRGTISGRTMEEVLRTARDLRPEDFAQRFRRANSQKRRYHGLRNLTQDLLGKVRYMNQVAVSMRSGLLDTEAAQQELDLTEAQMLELVKQMKNLAGVEG